MRVHLDLEVAESVLEARQVVTEHDRVPVDLVPAATWPAEQSLCLKNKSHDFSISGWMFNTNMPIYTVSERPNAIHSLSALAVFIVNIHQHSHASVASLSQLIIPAAHTYASHCEQLCTYAKKTLVTCFLTIS